MNNAKAKMTHTEHKTANYTAQKSDQLANPTRYTGRNKTFRGALLHKKRTTDAVTHALDTPRRPDTENKIIKNTNSHTTRRTRKPHSATMGYIHK